MRMNSSRFEVTSRRAALIRGVAIGAIVLAPGLACGGSSDEDVLANASNGTEVTATTAATATAATTVTTSGATDDTTAGAAGDTTVVDTSAASAVFPVGGEMVVDFAFTPASSGRVENPYIAVWVEDLDGNLVQTISLWIKQSSKGTKWLSELRRWYSTSGGDDTSMSSATRVAGSYSVVWDGTDLDGNAVAAGDYVIYIEAAREHGPYELLSQQVTIGADGFSVTVPGEGELTGASIDLVV